MSSVAGSGACGDHSPSFVEVWENNGIGGVVYRQEKGKQGMVSSMRKVDVNF